MEYTFVMIRPGAIRRNKVPFIFEKILEANLKVVCCKPKYLSIEFIYEHYSHLLNNPNIPEDVFIRTMKENLSGQVISMIVSGEDAISKTRELIGPSNVQRAINEFPNSIRALGDPNNNPDNLIHASDSVESANEEIKRFLGIDINNTKDITQQLLLIR